MKVVITTPTGNVGSRLVRLLLQAGVRPTLLLRDPDRLDAETRELVDTVQGDQLDAGDVLRATEGADALYSVDPPVDDEDPIATYARAGSHAARAIQEHAIARTLFQSSVGAEKRHGAGEIDGLARTEEQLDETGASVLHLRCGFFFTNLLMDPAALEEGVLRVAMSVDAPMPWVDPRDIGDVAAARLLSTGWVGPPRAGRARPGGPQLRAGDGDRQAGDRTAVARRAGPGRRRPRGVARGRTRGRAGRGGPRHVHRPARELHAREPAHDHHHHPDHARRLGARASASRRADLDDLTDR